MYAAGALETLPAVRASIRASVRLEFPDGRILFVNEWFCECKNIRAIGPDANEKKSNRFWKRK